MTIAVLAVLVSSLSAGAAKPPSTNLALWYAAGQANGDDKVTDWPNLAKDDAFPANLTTLRPSGGRTECAPKKVSDAVNGQPAVRFDGVKNLLTTGHFNLPQPFEVFAVVKFGAKEGYLLGSANTGKICEMGAFSGKRNIFMSCGRAQSPQASKSAFLDGFGLLDGLADGSNSFYAVNGVVVARDPVGPGPNGIERGVTVGAAGNGMWACEMDLAELLVYRTALSADERQAVVNYLSAKYGIEDESVPPPAAKDWVPATGAGFKAGTMRIDVPGGSREGNLLEEFKTPLQLEPGVYRVTATVLPQPLQNMGYEIVLAIHGPDPRKGKTDAKGRPFPPPPPLFEKRARAFQHDANGQLPITVEFALIQPTEVQISVGWQEGEYFRNSPDAHAQPASLEKLALKSLSYEKLPQAAWLGELKADKVVYKPGMAPVLSVPLVWTAAESKKLTVRVRQSKDIGESKIVATTEVEAARLLNPRAVPLVLGVRPPPFEQRIGQMVNVTLPALTEEGGYRFDLELLDGGKVIAARDRAAAVSKSYNRIGIYGSPRGGYLAMFQHIPLAGIDQNAEAARDCYISWMEYIFWAPDDFQGLAPKTDVWLGGAGYWMGRMDRFKRAGEAMKRCGVGAFAYAKGYVADGRDGFRWAQQHPELVLYHAETGRPLGSYDVEKFAHYDSDYIKKANQPYYWGYVCLNTGRPEVVDTSARSTIESLKMFGWAGIRFDGDFTLFPSGRMIEGPGLTLDGKEPATEKDYDYTWASNIQRYRKKVKAEFPDFEMGCNTLSMLDLPATLPAIAQDGGMFMNETIKGHTVTTHEYNPWKKYAEFIAHESRKVRAWGGFLQIIRGPGMRPDDYLYESVYIFAAQAKTFGGFFNTDFTIRMSRFVTRFSGILCADQYPVPNPSNRMTVTSSAPLEWENYVTFLEPSPGRRDYLMHFINPPVPDRANSIDDTRCLVREAVKSVVIDMDLDGSETPTAAWLLDPWNPDDMKPVKLTPRARGVRLELPDAVRIWSVVVLQCSVKG
ncbi:MAG TPA: hypothetical protein DCX07_15810 [Phycisphaerales bacterium]|nr:hypothetical protein [Phycisphaerales bacterium]